MKFRECGELLHGKGFPLRQKGLFTVAFCETSNAVWRRCMVPEGIPDGSFVEDGVVVGDSNA